jgi:hypothetical protein
MSDNELSAEQKGFVQGVAWAVAVLHNYHVSPSGLLQESGLNAEDFKRAGVIAKDMRVVRKLLKEIS